MRMSTIRRLYNIRTGYQVAGDMLYQVPGDMFW